MNFDPKVYSVLTKSGWHQSRELDERVIIEQITAEGYPVFEKVISFMKQFGGLFINFDNLQNGIKNDTIDLDFEKATHIEVPEKIKRNYVPRVKKDLCLIGTAYRDYLILLMSSDGFVYGAYENYLCFINKTGEGALESIILNKNFVEITD
jgi:hypothetical protein